MTSTDPHPASYSERLTPAGWIHVSAVLMAAGFGLAFARLNAQAAVVAFIVVAALLLFGLWSTTPLVAVSSGTLRAGRAQVPAGVLGAVTVLDAAAMRRATGPGLDARAYLCLRGWIPTGVRVDLVDTGDPTPYWLISSRRPQLLADAIRSASTASSPS